MDHLTKSKRSENMSRIKNKNTTPEIAVRKTLHSMGYRYRLHSASVYGKPDIVIKTKRKAVFVHGCFWHRHKNCSLATKPKTNTSYWEKKFQTNIARDKKVQERLDKENWKFLIIWECEIKDKTELKKKLTKFMEL